MENRVKNDWLSDYLGIVNDYWNRQETKNITKKGIDIPEVENIIFHEPATIIFWKDGTKTVVKAMDGDTFNEEHGVAMAYMKKILGSSTAFRKLVAKYASVKTEKGIKVGDRIVGIGECDLKNIEGLLGTVMYIDKSKVGFHRDRFNIYFDEDIQGWENKERGIPNGHGWSLFQENFKLLTE